MGLRIADGDRAAAIRTVCYEHASIEDAVLVDGAVPEILAQTQAGIA